MHISTQPSTFPLYHPRPLKVTAFDFRSNSFFMFGFSSEMISIAVRSLVFTGCAHTTSCKHYPAIDRLAVSTSPPSFSEIAHEIVVDNERKKQNYE